MSIEELIQKEQYEEALLQVDTISEPSWKKYELQAVIFIKSGKFIDAKQAIDAMEDVLELEKGRGYRIYLFKAYLNYKQGLRSKAKSHLKNYEKHASGINQDDISLAGLYHHIKGSIFLMEGDKSKAKEHLHRALQLRKGGGNLQDLAGTLNNLGSLYRRQGLLHLAVHHYQQALEIFTELGNDMNMAMTRNNLGVIHGNRGELEQSKKYHEENLKYYTTIGNEKKIARSLNNLGSVYRDLNDYEYAEELHRRSLEYRIEANNPEELFNSYFYLTYTLIEAEKLQEATRYLKIIGDLEEDNPSDSHKIIHDFLWAMWYHKQPRFVAKQKAIDLFKELIDRKEIEPEIEFTSIVRLIELLFFELITFQNLELLTDISEKIAYLTQKTRQRSYSLFYLKAILLQAKFSFIQNEIELTEEYYNEALKIATEHELHNYKEHIRNELTSFQKKINQWVKLSDDQETLIERIKSSMIMKYLDDVKRILSD